MKYRVIVSDSELWPFKVQKKNDKSFFPFWKNVTEFKQAYDAENFIRRTVERQVLFVKGQIIFEYTEADLVVDRLKNSSRKESEIGAAMSEAQHVHGMVQNNSQRLMK